MKIGKLSNEELRSIILAHIDRRRSEIIVGAGLGEDCVAFSSQDILLISTDPITTEVQNTGALAVRVATNDIIASGGEPLLIMLTIIAPPSATPAQLAQIMRDAEGEAIALNAEIAGGHTEISDAVNRIIVSSTVVGIATAHFKTSNISVGDAIFITKNIGIEGTAILYDKYEQELANSFSDTEKAVIQSLKEQTSVAKEGLVARKCDIKFMHDITEGGIFGALAEVADGINAQLQVETKAIPYSAVTKKLAELLNVDIYRLMSSGSLIIITANPQKLIAEFAKNNLKITQIGQVTQGRGAIAKGVESEQILNTQPDAVFIKNQKTL